MTSLTLTKLRCIVTCCLLLLATHAVAGAYEDAIAAYDRGDFENALKLWLPLAEQGQAAAQFNVGVLYEKGLGTLANHAEAARWYLKAAQQGDPDAQYSIGILYEMGDGVPHDLGQARTWFAQVIANARATAASPVRQRAKEKLANLAAASKEAIDYDGGRFVIVASDPHACVVALQGGITNDANRKFDQIVAKTEMLACDRPWLLLESPGGLLKDGIALGKAVRFGKFRTLTRYECASACALIFLAGSERVLLGSRAKIGFHQASTRRAKGDRHCSSSFDDGGVREMRRYLTWIIPEQADFLLELIQRTPCDRIEWTSGRFAIDAGIATRIESEDVDVFGAKTRGQRP